MTRRGDKNATCQKQMQSNKNDIQKNFPVK